MKERILFTVFLLCMIVFGRSDDSYALENEDYQYYVNADESITIRKYQGSGGDIVIPSEIDGKKVTAIYPFAFQYANLADVVIPDSITNIGRDAFAHSSLTSVMIGKGVTGIPMCAFAGCGSLASVTIPEGVTGIGDNAFSGCGSLESIMFPDSIYRIEEYAFSDCSSLTSIIIPGSVNRIEEGVFSNCSSLANVTIQEGVESISCKAFLNCTSLTGITIPSSIEHLGYWMSTVSGTEYGHAFSGCSSLAEIKVESGNKWYDSREKCNGIIETKSNTLIVGCKNTQIPNNVINIGEAAFQGQTDLTGVIIPDSVERIGKYAFEECSNLENIAVPGSVSEIMDFAFENCSSLADITIADGVIKIEKGAFWGCRSLESIMIPDSVKRIGGGAFGDCSGLTCVTIPDNVTLGTEVFFGCSSLTTNIIIPEGQDKIWDQTFYGCSSLTGIYIPGSVKSIGIRAFYNCSSLTDIYYSGSESEWASISTGLYNEPLNNAAIHYNSKWNFSLFQTKSTKYNNALARIAADMSEKTEDGENAIRELYHSCGLYACEYKNFSFADWKSAAYAIGQDTIAINGVDTTILVITARGTRNLAEGIGDIFKGGETDFLGTKVWKNVYDFEEEIWNGLNDYIDKYPAIKSKQNLKILVNGHSLGGAAANLLGARFTHEVGGSDWWSDLVEKEDIYVYTFGAIKVLTEVHKNSNISEGYENIHNIYNYFDSYGPHGNQSWTNVSVPKAKFGHTEVYRSYRFKYDETPNIPWLTCNSHQMSNYKAALEEDLVSCSDGKRIRAKERLAKLKEHVSGIWQNVNKIISGISVLCPVDVEIYTSDGRLAGSITDNAAGETISDKVYICIEGDEKYIYLLDDGSYTLRLKGTAGGTMEYSVQNIDIDTGEAAEEQTFANVSLEADKRFAGSVKVEKNRITDIETEEVRLYVVDGNGKPQKEVLPDGSGTEVSVSQKTEDSGFGKENSAVKVSKIQISGISKKIAAGKKIVLKAEISPANATNKAVSWSVDNTKYAAVDNSGVVTIKKAGKGKTVTITAAAKDGSKVKAVYRIKCMKGAVKKVTVSGKRTRSAKAGSSIKLKAKVKASSGANKALQWLSSNFNYASIDKKGKVTLNKAGKGKTVKITAMATDGSGKKAVVKIKII